MAEKILVPDIGDAADVEVIEIMVSVGDTVAVDDSIITLEGDKATMDVPSTHAGVVESVDVKVGDKISEGSLILTVKSENLEKAPKEPRPKEASSAEGAKKPQEEASSDPSQQTVDLDPAAKPRDDNGGAGDDGGVPDKSGVRHESDIHGDSDARDYDNDDIHAGPGVRRIAHEFGINLTKIKGTGAKGRITKEDAQAFVKSQLKIAENGGAGLAIAPLPKVDFSRFGPTEAKDLNKIKKLTAAAMSRNWVSIPHVTQFDEADITELEAFRQEQKAIAAEQGIRLTPLVFIMKALVAALHEFPAFNASLGPSGEQLILKKYFNIGVAVDTPNGLVVPVIRDADKKGIYDIAKELGDISKKARETGLGMSDMQGGCMTISSLGGIGGTAFTPIINAPEVAILGVSKSVRKPIVQPNGEILPRLMLPLSLSYDHRVIDGAEAARFIVFLSSRLADIRNILL